MDRCDAYRHFSAQCLELARSMESPQDRAVLLQMALIWSRLAECAAQVAAGALNGADPKPQTQE
jgi:hypothetical protein